MIDRKKVKRWYVNDSLEKNEVTVDGVNFSMTKMPVFDGMKVFNRTAKLLSPLIGMMGDKKKLDFSVLSEIDDDGVTEHIKVLCELCQKDGEMVIFDVDMKNYKMPYLLAFEFAKWNFSDFLTSNPKLQKVAETAMGIDLEKMKNS
jgi:hypothetical protein